MGILDGIAKAYRLTLACLELHLLLLAFHFYNGLTGVSSLVLHRHFYIHCGFFSRYVARGNKHAVLGDVQEWHRLQPHVTINTRTRIPATVHLLTIINLHHHFVQALVLI